MKKVARMDTVFLSGGEGCALSVCINAFLPVGFGKENCEKSLKTLVKKGLKSGDHKMFLKPNR